IACRPNDVLVASTGVIGVPLPMTKVRRGIRAAVSGLTARGFDRAARAIMTTDTVPKTAERRFEVEGREARLFGI
ncbi:MAG: ornithine acetyltransferase, partial [Gemmatimonadetes bacterium]|nr:ornithine acetyltransferase [Gemmatimonadota bacterium]